MITVFVDGACEPRNPGGHGACAFIAFKGAVTGEKDAPRPAPLIRSAKLIGHGPGMTNNVAEWRALRGALWWFESQAHLYAAEDIIIFMDSQLVAYQFIGKWQCNAIELQKFKNECLQKAKAFSRLQVQWIPRDQNWVADNLINELYARHNITVTVRPKKQRRMMDDEDLDRLVDTPRRARDIDEP